VTPIDQGPWHVHVLIQELLMSARDPSLSGFGRHGMGQLRPMSLPLHVPIVILRTGCVKHCEISGVCNLPRYSEILLANTHTFLSFPTEGIFYIKDLVSPVFDLIYFVILFVVMITW
jgi:hypothetical protein